MTTKLPNILVLHFESLIFAERTCSIDLIEHPKVVDRGRHVGKKMEKNVQTMEVHTKSMVDVDADKGNFG